VAGAIVVFNFDPNGGVFVFLIMSEEEVGGGVGIGSGFQKRDEGGPVRNRSAPALDGHREGGSGGDESEEEGGGGHCFRRILIQSREFGARVKFVSLCQEIR